MKGDGRWAPITQQMRSLPGGRAARWDGGSCLKRQPREVGSGNARSLDEDDAAGNWLECGAEMSLALQAEHAVPRRIDAVAAEDVQIDGVSARVVTRTSTGGAGWPASGSQRRSAVGPRSTVETGHHRAVVDVVTVAEQLDVGPASAVDRHAGDRSCRRGRQRSCRRDRRRSRARTISGSVTIATAAPATCSAKRKRTSSALSPGPPSTDCRRCPPAPADR